MEVQNILKHLICFVLPVLDAKGMMLPASTCLQVEATWICLMENAGGGKRKHEMEMSLQNQIALLLVSLFWSGMIAQR